ncbi:hypothetical protein FA95DRAFT_665301 [Auriscalpium vulgare]|uniref:Uncharacterized protein n=1 Tax=Auriscalpium vulgare TaxID=40419 RepID=A0ACB8S2G3_9AGAM|nr:hypothetical protein FA95DRAFT_665301 [Auriscalpium vulgare]
MLRCLLSCVHPTAHETSSIDPSTSATITETEGTERKKGAEKTRGSRRARNHRWHWKGPPVTIVSTDGEAIATEHGVALATTGGFAKASCGGLAIASRGRVARAKGAGVVCVRPSGAKAPLDDFTQILDGILQRSGKLHSLEWNCWCAGPANEEEWIARATVDGNVIGQGQSWHLNEAKLIAVARALAVITARRSRSAVVIEDHEGVQLSVIVTPSPEATTGL